MNSISRIFASVVGGFIMKTIALFFSLHPLGIAFSAIVGAAAGWVLYDIPGLVRAIGTALSAIAGIRIDLRPFFRGLMLFTTGFILAWLNSTALFSSVLVAINISSGAPITEGLMGAMGVGLFIALIGGTPVDGPGANRHCTNQDCMYLDDGFRKDALKGLVFYTNPIALAFWTLYITFYYLPKEIPGAVKFCWKICRYTFAITHNGARRLCAIDSVLCGSAWLASGNDPYIGVAVGTLLGLFHYRLTGEWAKQTLEQLRLATNK